MAEGKGSTNQPSTSTGLSASAGPSPSGEDTRGPPTGWDNLPKEVLISKYFTPFFEILTHFLNLCKY